MGNGTLVSGSGITSAPASVEIIWQTTSNLITRTYNSSDQTVTDLSVFDLFENLNKYRYAE